jgi:hypothetical protein
VPPVLVYVLALLLGAALVAVAWRFWPRRKKLPRPEPASVALNDPTLTCRLVSAAEGAEIVGERTLWWANGPTMERSALIYPYGYLGRYLELAHPDEDALHQVRRLLATARADYVLVHPTRYYPVGLALRPNDKKEHARLAREQLATLAQRVGWQVLWVPFGYTGDIDDVVKAIQAGELQPILELNGEGDAHDA